jgi:hypothetical protein
MSDPLATYLHDHLAGAQHAIELVDFLRTRHEGHPLGDFAGTLLAEIEADRATLQTLADSIGAGSSKIKDLAGWVSEKVSRIKLHDDPDGLGTFEALEFLALGIRGKRLLWIALSAIAPADHRLQGTDFARLIARAKIQQEQVEERRLEIATTALAPK